MEEDARPDPDLLLARIQEEEEQKKRGRLKIFLGYAAGVGKTYEMLKAADQRRNEGRDLQVGYVETHGRKETADLLQGLPLIPRITIPYKTTSLEEMDLDAILSIHPEIVLVDELAHTNAPGLRHQKRYQDVDELLKAGIDVYTTLNIQHLDSLRDLVAQITGVRVHETVPDRIIDEADEIELIDLPPVELIRRLRDGKVYLPEMAEQAALRFFKEGNLDALREISLRKTAERVDTQMFTYMQNQAISGPWAAAEHLLVSIGPSPLSERLVRTARRQADRMNTDWRAVYVETPAHSRLSTKDKEQIWRTIKLAESLGAKTETVFGTSVPDMVIEYAKKRNITRIVIGKTLRPRWKEIVYGSIVDQMIHKSGSIDVYVVSSGEEYELAKPGGFGSFVPEISRARWIESMLLVGGVTIFGEATKGFISQTNLMMLYLMIVVIAAFRNGLYLAIFTAIIGVSAFDFFLVPPYYTFRVSDTEYLITFCGMLLVGGIISLLISRVHEHALSAQSREMENAMLYKLAKKLTGAPDMEHIITAVISRIEENFTWKAAILMPVQGKIQVRGSSSGLVMTGSEIAVASWAYNNNSIAGYDTDTLHASRFRFIPLSSRQGVLGILGVRPNEPDGVISPEDGRVLEIFADLVALAMERFSQNSDQFETNG